MHTQPARLLGQAVEVGRPAVERRLVDLEVAGVQDPAERGVDHDGHAVRDRVRDAQEPHRERPHGRRPLPRRDHVELAPIGNTVLFQLALEQRQRERGPVDGDIGQLAEQVRQRADVIFVPVREHDAPRSDPRAPGRSRSPAGPGRYRTCPPTGTKGPRRPTGCDRPARCRPCSGPPRRRHRGRRRGHRCQRRPASSSALRTRARSSAVAGTSGSRGTPGREADHPERRLQRDGVARDEQGVEERGEVLVDLAGGGDVAGLDQLDHLADLRADQMARHGDEPDRAQADIAERRPVVSAVDLEVGRRLGHQPRHPLEVAGGILHRDDVGTRGELQQRVVLDARRGPAGDVVDDDRQLRRVGHAFEVRDQAALRRLVVVRGHDEQSVGAGVLRRLGQLERLGRGVRPGAADQLAAAARTTSPTARNSSAFSL